MSASDITSDYDRLLDRMRRACSRREYCSADIRRKLSAAGAPSALSGKILSSLKSEGYLDDGRYARAYCRDKSGLSGWGEAKIRYALGLKGIPGPVIDEALLPSFLQSWLKSSAAIRGFPAASAFPVFFALRQGAAIPMLR